ncbi:hypothetical protein SNE40_011337 [Patella caerulea]|uniref:Uncharacterized protein n=1 Tax=Patella caerulea TaxID=87958 RepID=A0AAN8PP84_PATCE
MELTEVVSTHVALPVIGVLLCALLVFAFGFRSPVQPPSFDFSEDKKNQKKTKKSKTKGQTNGHAVTVKEETAAVKSVSPKSARQAAKPKSPASEKKIKKADRAPARNVTERSRPQQSEVIDNDEGWSVAVSKKKEKVRSKREEKSDYVESKLTLEDIGFEKPATAEETLQEAPQDQRPSKKKRQSKKSEGEVTSEPEPVVENTPPPAEPVEPEPVKQEPKPITVVEETKPVEQKQSAPAKRSKAKSESNCEKTETKDAPKENTPASPNKKKSKGKKLSAEAEEFQPIMYESKPEAQISPKKPRSKKNTHEPIADDTLPGFEEKFTEIKPIGKKEKEDKTPSPPKGKS